MNEAPERLLSTREIADLLGLTPRQIIRLRTEAGLPSYRLGARQIVRFRASEVETWLQEHKKESA